MHFEFKVENNRQLIFAKNELGEIMLTGQVFKGFISNEIRTHHYLKIRQYNIVIVITDTINNKNMVSAEWLIDVSSQMATWYFENKIEPNKSYYKRYLDKS